MNTKIIAFAVTLVAGIGFDQATKVWARSSEALQSPMGWAIHDKLLHFVHRENPGAAFSLFASLPETYRTPMFVVLNLVAIGIGVNILRKTKPDSWGRGVWVGMFLGGAIGNLIDRLMQGTVTDFIRVHIDYEPVYGWLVGLFGRADWPVFNIADALLLIGVFGLALVDWLAPEEAKAETPDAAAA